MKHHFPRQRSAYLTQRKIYRMWLWIYSFYVWFKLWLAERKEKSLASYGSLGKAEDALGQTPIPLPPLAKMPSEFGHT